MSKLSTILRVRARGGGRSSLGIFFLGLHLMQGAPASNAGPPCISCRGPLRDGEAAKESDVDGAIPLLVVLPSRSDTEGGVLRRSTHAPARRSHAPRRATRGAWPRLRYRLIARLVAAPSAPLTLRAGQPRFAGPQAPLTLRPCPGPRAVAPRLDRPWGCADGRHGGAPLTRLRIAPLARATINRRGGPARSIGAPGR